MMIDTTALQLEMMNSLERLYLGDLTSKVTEYDSTLTISSSDSAWLEAALKVIGYEHPGEKRKIYTGVLAPNSLGYFEIIVYEFAQDSYGEGSYTIPRYACGTWRKWPNTFALINVNDYTFQYNNGLVDMFYPVGSYYETSNTSFNPNVSWGGTWVKDSVGKVTVAQDTSVTAFNTVGGTGGSKDAVLVSHTHSVTATEANVSITGGSHSHPVYYRSDNTTGGSADRLGVSSTHAGTRSGAATATSHTHSLPAHKHTLDTKGVAGTDKNLQPYVVVIRWHRTA